MDHGSRYDVSMVWHQSATADPAHVWLRSMVRRLFQRSANQGSTALTGRIGSQKSPEQT